MDSYTNANMVLGHEREIEARDLYAMIKEVDVDQVGFIKSDNCGCSPDGLVGSVGMYENKNAAPHIQIERLLKGTMPTEHIAQCQGQLMVAQREWCDFMSYCRGLPPLIIRIERDEKYIAGLRIDVNEFVDELNELLTTIRSM